MICSLATIVLICQGLPTGTWPAWRQPSGSWLWDKAWQEAVGETCSAARGYGLQPGIWKSEENACARKNDRRKISAGVPLTCPSFGPPLLAGLKTATVMGNILQLWGSNLSSFGCPHIGEYWPKKVCLKPLQVSAQSTSTDTQSSLCSDHLINYEGKSDVPKPSQSLGSCWIQ